MEESAKPQGDATDSLEKPKLHSTSQKKRLYFMLAGVISACIVFGIWYIAIGKGLTSQQKNSSLAPTPSPNLNPGTGDPYKDIELRLKEVLK